MTMTKKLLLGSAAAAMMFGSTASMAADAPQAPSRTPVWACDITGFWELPGTDICFKVGGFARADFAFTTENLQSDTFDVFSINNATNSNERVTFFSYVSRLNFDARSNTEYGTVRAFIEFDFAGGQGNQVISNSRHPRLRHAYVQFGNLLAGQTWSNAMILASLADGLDFEGVDHFPLIRQTQLRWTQPMGNGVTFSIALENPENMDKGVNGATDHVPDLTARISISQSWGNLSIAGALREVDHNGFFANRREVGWMAQIGGQINVPVANGNDNFKWSAAYSDGGTRYMLHGALLTLVQNTMFIFDERNANADLLKMWSVHGAYQHFWSNNLRSSIIAGTTRITNIGATPAATDRSVTVQGNLIWSPVPRVDIGAEVLWGRRHQVNGTTHSATRVLGVVRRSF